MIDWSKLITQEDKEQQLLEAKNKDLADLRWKKETGGLTLPNGFRVITTRESQSQLVSTVNSLQNGLISEPVTWKLDSGWADLSASQILYVAQAVAQHVAKCFKAEQVVSQTLTLSTDIEAEFNQAYAEIQ